MYQQRYYRLLLVLAITAVAVSLAGVYYLHNPWQTLLAGIAGGFASLAASTFIQNLAFSEQALMLRAVTFALPGVAPLPKDFFDLQWIAYVTQVADKEGGKKSISIICRLKKVRSIGKNIVEYKWMAHSPSGKIVPYPCTFIGLDKCVVAIIGKQGEASSVIVLDAPVPDVEIYFGSGYVINWLGGRTASFQVVGSTPVPNSFAEISLDEQQRFKDWFSAVEWNVQNAYKPFTGET